MKNRLALIVGRFQPFHKGHLFLIKKALEKADQIIIGIGSANILDVNNPIDFETRKKVIKAVFYKEGIEEKLVKVVPLDDFFDDQKWLNNLKKQVGKFDIALGNNEWTNNILKKAGSNVLEVNYCKRSLYEGWRIRKLMREEKNPPSLKLRRAKWQNRVPDYIVKWLYGYMVENKNNITIKQYNNVVLGGTFDHFHKGHEVLIKKAFEIGKKITIGIATKEIYKNKFLSETIESFEIRKKSVENFVKNAEIISFSEFTGGVDKIKEIDAIVVSKETFPNALKINELREKNKLKPMMIVIVEDILAKDGKLISSERIRSGEIDRNGKVFELIPNPKSLVSNPYLKMPEILRPLLQKPLGKVFKNTKSLLHYINIMKWTMIITVGDIISDSLLKEGIDPDVKVIDFRSRRNVIPVTILGQAPTGIQAVKPAIKSKFQNKPGTINLKTAGELQRLIKDCPYKDSPCTSWLVVDGEEDLLTLPAILFAPLGSLVLYGHWEYGIISVEVNEEIKEKVKTILNKFC